MSSGELAKQIAEEIEMLHLGKRKFRERAQAAEEKGRQTQHGAGLLILLDVVPRLSAAIKEHCSKKRVGSGGRLGLAGLALRALPTDVSALIAARTVLDSVSRREKLTGTVDRVGRRVEDEVRFRHFRQYDPEGYNKAVANVMVSQNYDYQRRRLVFYSNANPAVPAWERWPKSKRIAVGALLVELLIATSNAVQIEEGHGVTYITATAELVASLSTLNERLEVMMPWYLPSTTVPKTWEGGEAGGYWSFDVPLVKPRSGSYQHLTSERPPHVILNAVNAIQRTPWRVNETVLTLVSHLYNTTEFALPGIPPRSPHPMPTRPIELPFDVKPELFDEVQAEMYKAWRRAKAQAFDEEQRRKSRLITAAKLISSATELKDEPAFYFPHQLDWRGRAYPLPKFLSPQGPDLARGLLEFAEAKPLATPEGVKWFLVTGANHFGVDKVSLDARVHWVEDHWDLILETAANPDLSRWWMEAAEPWQFVAWCLEAAEWHAAGRPLDFESRVVVGMDGSCNGLQHYSAILRDERGGKAVNLVPSEIPQDIYQEVADVVRAELEELGDAGDDYEARMARAWLNSGLLGRSIVKRQVMTLPYGSTSHGMQAQLIDYLTELRDDGVEVPLEEQWDAAMLLTRLIRDAITHVVLAAPVLMRWLQKCAWIVSERGLPLRWTTPAGLEVRQHYRAERRFRVHTTLLGELTLRVREDKNTLSGRKQAAGIAPNFIHSLDSSHMMMTVDAMEAREREKPVSWSMIHDSYGCHAGDAPELAATLREQFVRLYTEHDVLAEFKRDVERDTGLILPEPPGIGTLNLGEIAQALYFFA